MVEKLIFVLDDSFTARTLCACSIILVNTYLGHLHRPTVGGGKVSRGELWTDLHQDSSYPDYGYAFDGNTLKSTPLSATAQQKYPAHLNFKGTIRVGNHYFSDATENPMDYAYRHQLELVMSVNEAVKLLGNRSDPIQREAEQFVGKDTV